MGFAFFVIALAVESPQLRPSFEGITPITKAEEFLCVQCCEGEWKQTIHLKCSNDIVSQKLLSPSFGVFLIYMYSECEMAQSVDIGTNKNFNILAT